MEAFCETYKFRSNKARFSSIICFLKLLTNFLFVLEVKNKLIHLQQTKTSKLLAFFQIL